MQEKDLKKTQHFTEDWRLLENLERDLPNNIEIIEPFCGNGDLVRFFKNKIKKLEAFDLEKRADFVVVKDSLKEKIDYKGKWVITNPPFLRKNQSSNKEYFKDFEEDDLFKIFLETIKEVEGGVLVLPLNFLIDESSKKVRETFLKIFQIKTLNIPNSKVFKRTSYWCISFSFERLKEKREESKIFFIDTKEEIFLKIEKKLFEELYKENFERPNLFKLERLTENNHKSLQKIPLIFYTIDKNNKDFSIRAEFNEEVKITGEGDRNAFSFGFNKNIFNRRTFKEEDWRKIAENFNRNLNILRIESKNLLLTNFRDFNRKRISITEIKSLLNKTLEEYKRD